MRERDLLRLGIPPPDALRILRNLPALLATRPPAEAMPLGAGPHAPGSRPAFRAFAPPFADRSPGWPVPGWR